MSGTVVAVAGFAAGVLLSREAAHPLATRNPWAVWFVYQTPSLLLFAAGLCVRSHGGLLAGVAALGLFVAVLATASCEQDTRISLSLLRARAAGRHGMSCGPPISLVAIPTAYGAALLGGWAALAYTIKRPDQNAR